MLQTPRSLAGMVTAPHHLAAQAGRDVLSEGGNAIEAMIAAAATIAVVYPHMTGIGGDGFWLAAAPGEAPIAIRACGPTGAAVTPELYQRHGHASIPARGPLAANTVAGTVAGWQAAQDLARRWGGTMPFKRLLEPAIAYARGGVALTRSQARLTAEKAAECRDQPGFAATFMAHGAAPAVGGVMKQEALARTLEWLAQAGCEDFYRGELARMIAADLARVGAPITGDDLARMRAIELAPLSIELAGASAFNLPPPTQGFASLIILALAERFGVDWRDEGASIHALVEATKLALRTRDAELRDPASMRVDANTLITPEAIDALARGYDPARAALWPAPVDKGDTVWMGAIDHAGRAVSFIQSLYWEFGSAVVLRDCGFVWQNRGTSFPLDPDHPNRLAPGRLPFHTLNPALARLADGRVVVYGTMGGDGQPQTQAAIFTRLRAGHEPQQAVSAPRWLLGRTWGTTVTRLRVESRVSPEAIDRLRALGHDLEVIEPYSDLTGHAGMIVRRPDGVLEGAADPRGDGLVAAI